MAFGKWKSIGIVVALPNGEKFVVPVGGGGKLIYEEFDPATGKSGSTSRFYEINTVNLTPPKEGEGADVEGHLKLNLSDDSVTELLVKDT